MDISALNVEETADFISAKLNMPDLAVLFKEQDVDGSVLLLLTTATIKDFLPTVTLGQCVKLFNRLKPYLNSPTEDGASKQNPTTSTLQRLPSPTPPSPRSLSPRSPSPPPSPPLIITPVSATHSPQPTASIQQPETPEADFQKSSESPITSTPSRIRLPIPKEFPIDNVPIAAPGVTMIRTGEISVSGKTAITNAMVTQMHRFSNSDGYASHNLKRMAATALVYKYPSLTMGMDINSAVDAWHKAFGQKLCNWRKRGKVLDPNMETMKVKYRAQASRSAEGLGQDTPKRRKIVFPTTPTREEAEEQKLLKEIIKEEMAKPLKQRNRRIVDDSMCDSFHIRRQFIVEGAPHACDLLREWPALRTEPIIFKEFQRVVPAVASSLQFQASVEKIMPALISEVQQKSRSYTKSHPLCQLMASGPHLDNTDPDYDTDFNVIIGMVGLTYILPTTSKKTTSPHRFLIDVCPVGTTNEEIKSAVPERNQPFIVVFGTLTHRQKVVLYVEQIPVCVFSSMKNALYAMAAFYFIMDVQFCKRIVSSLEFMQAAFLALPPSGKSLPTKVRELVQKLSV